MSPVELVVQTIPSSFRDKEQMLLSAFLLKTSRQLARNVQQHGSNQARW